MPARSLRLACNRGLSAAPARRCAWRGRPGRSRGSDPSRRHKTQPALLGPRINGGGGCPQRLPDHANVHDDELHPLCELLDAEVLRCFLLKFAEHLSPACYDQSTGRAGCPVGAVRPDSGVRSLSAPGGLAGPPRVALRRRVVSVKPSRTSDHEIVNGRDGVGDFNEALSSAWTR